MIEFVGFLELIAFDEKKFRQSVDRELQVQLRQAARAWLRAVIPSVPVYTGMARGTLQPLGRALRVAIPISPVAVRKGKNAAAGSAQSQFEFTSSGGLYTFSWSNDVLHYNINEYNNMSGVIPLKNPTPWRSLAKGKAAFDSYCANILPGKMPKAGAATNFISEERRV